MKKILSVLTIGTITVLAFSCGNPNSNGTTSGSDSSSSNVTKPADNNSATNPSLADTSYSPDSSKMHKDSSKMK